MSVIATTDTFPQDNGLHREWSTPCYASPGVAQEPHSGVAISVALDAGEGSGLPLAFCGPSSQPVVWFI